MERLSVFDIFKIGVGPSSSHTLGPWKAALDFRNSIGPEEWSKVHTLEVFLYGSLSKTGKGHGTDIAVIMGLLGHDPVTVNTAKINDFVQEVYNEESISIHDKPVYFAPNTHIHFEPFEKEYHPNTLEILIRFNDNTHRREQYYSVGGGFIEKQNQSKGNAHSIELPFPIDRASELLNYTIQNKCAISDVVYENEKAFRPEDAINTQIASIYDTMLQCVYRGCHTEGILPGGLSVTRRAYTLSSQLMELTKSTNNPEEWLHNIKNQKHAFNTINKWVSCFALAVNEENAAFGRVVTSPTNGAAGVIPAVLLYYLCFCDNAQESDIKKFILTSGEIGSLFKKGATISAAVGGCQAEIGVSSSMAAAGLTEILGGNPQQVLMAAEIAMEHHLGLTCDPIGGLVQIPCIERNAMGAMKAITASTLALSSDANRAIVSLDDVIKTMWETAQDMNNKYKETAEGGLAINLSVIQPSC